MDKMVKLEDVIKLITDINGHSLDEVLVAINKLETVSNYDELEKLFPYKVGDVLYEIDYFWDEPCIRQCKVSNLSKCFLINNKLGESYFLTKEEAERKIRELSVMEENK